MSYNTKVVVFVGSAADEDALRVFEALTRYAETHTHVADFERHSPDPTRLVLTDGHGEVIVGSVNHLNRDDFLVALRAAAQNPAWSTDFAPLVVILRGDDDDERPRTHTLDADGNWS